jgi:hypothetical protein
MVPRLATTIPARRISSDDTPTCTKRLRFIAPTLDHHVAESINDDLPDGVNEVPMQTILTVRTGPGLYEFTRK